MALSYLQIPFDYDDLLRLYETKYFGAAFSNLHNLEPRGIFVATGEWGGIETIETHLQSGLPVLVNLQTGELKSYWNREASHVVLVIGLENGEVIVNDPAFDDAPKRISIGEFMLAWDEQYQRSGVIGLAEIQL